MATNTGETSEAYFLSEAFINGQVFEIGLDQYATLSAALKTVVSAMEIEELFQVFAQSFIRFEKDLLEVALEYAFATDQDVYDGLFFLTAFGTALMSTSSQS